MLSGCACDCVCVHLLKGADFSVDRETEHGVNGQLLSNRDLLKEYQESELLSLFLQEN